MILLPDMPFGVSWIIKLAVSLIIVLISFGYVNLRGLIKNTAVFFMISFWPKNEICRIRVINNNHYSEFYGKSDTGNTLCEPFSNIPVIVVNESAVKETAEEEFKKLMYMKEPECMLKGKYRLIPFHSVGGSGLLPAFIPDEVYINNVYCCKRVYIAVCRNTILEGEIKAMVNPEIIEAVKDDCDDSCKII